MATKSWSEEFLMKFYHDDDIQEVKGHQRSNVLNYVLLLSTWSEEYLMQVYYDNNLYGG